jgi:hypothetical protein
MELDLNLSPPSGLVAHGAISPSLDEITAAGAPDEFKVDGESVLLGHGQIGARLRGRRWSLAEGIGLPLGVFLGLVAGGVRVSMCSFSELANVGIMAIGICKPALSVVEAFTGEGLEQVPALNERRLFRGILESGRVI